MPIGLPFVGGRGRRKRGWEAGMLLMLDNYDSFTFNLVQYLQALGAEVQVERNDALDVDAIAQLGPEKIVISPGPGPPNEAGGSLTLVATLGPRVPIPGLGLGHQ